MSIVLPTYNEAENILPMIQRLSAALAEPEIIVVDDNSPDRTWEMAEAAGARVIRRTDERGLASALACGIAAARGEIIVWMDCDLSMPPEDALRLLNALRGGADIAVGSRYAPPGRDARPIMRRLTSRLINLFANILLPFKVKDYDSGFIAARRSVFHTIPLSPDGYGDYCIEFLCAAGLSGFNIVEVGYTFTDRSAGRSKTVQGFLSFLYLGMKYIRRILYLHGKFKSGAG